MSSILAFGDSNTWGFVPGTKTYARFAEDVRWTGILRRKCANCHVIEEGLCGRTTVFEDCRRPGRKGIDALPEILDRNPSLNAIVIMLGTNDCKSAYDASADTIGEGMELCISEAKKHISPDRILLVSPIFLGKDVWKPNKDPEFDHDSIAKSHELKDVYQRLARKHGTQFMAASDFVTADEADNEHIGSEGHKLFATAIYEKLHTMKVV